MKHSIPTCDFVAGLPVEILHQELAAANKITALGKRKLSAEFRMHVTNEDMMIQAARLILSTDADGTDEGRSKVLHSPFQLIVHQDSSGTRVHTDQGDVELPEIQAERIAVQAEIIPAARPVADPDGETPAWLVQRVLARDNQTCQNCGQNLYLQVHHIEFRSQGGKTAEDKLVAVCSTCHSLIHQGLLHLHSDQSGGVTFLDAGGAGVESESAPGLAKREVASREVTSRGLAGGHAAQHSVLGAALANPPRTRADRLANTFRVVRTRRELAPSGSTGCSPSGDYGP